MIGRRREPAGPLNRAVRNLQNKLKSSFLTSYPHHTVPGCNLNINPNIENYDVDHVLQLFKEFPYNTDLPKPLLPPARLPQSVLENGDPALQLLTIKSEVNENINQLTEHSKKYKKDLTVCYKKDVMPRGKKNHKREAFLPRYIAELAEIIDSDPDPEFKGEYNWYYTGGSLDHLTISNNNILLFPYADELVAVPVIDESNFLWKPNLNIAAKCGLESTLYEIRHSIAPDGTYRILGRQKYFCNLYSLSEFGEEVELREIHVQPSDLPYISADLSPIENKYCVVRGKRLIELRDLQNVKCLRSLSILKNENLPDNWMTIKFEQSDPNLIAIVDRCCLHHVDLRTPSNGPNLTLCPKNKLEICESISLNFPSKHNSFYQYLGTYHSLLLCDCRFPGSSIVQKWTHQFKSPPLFAATVERNEEEVITVSSQLSGENSVILNTWTSDTQAYSYSLPYMASSISETLEACQEEGKCLDPNMRTRIDLCTAGATLNLNTSNYATFFTQNSIGDIFYQCLTRDKKLGKNSQKNDKCLLALDAWEQAYLKQCQTIKPLVVSEKLNMRYVLDGINGDCTLKQEEKNEEKTEKGSEEESKPIPEWHQSLEKLDSYVDILAPQLFSVWDVSEGNVAHNVSPQEKVWSWLDKKPSSQNLRQSQSLIQSQNDSSMFKSTDEIFSQQLLSVSQNTQTHGTPNNTTNQDDNVFRTPAPVTKRKRIIKKKHVPGF